MNLGDTHRITRGEIEHILKCLRFIDRAREALSGGDPVTEQIVADLKTSVGGIYHVVKELPRIE